MSLWKRMKQYIFLMILISSLGIAACGGSGGQSCEDHDDCPDDQFCDFEDINGGTCQNFDEGDNDEGFDDDDFDFITQ